MAEKATTKENQSALATVSEKAITYQTNSGDSVTLTEAAVMAITNNNQYITQGEIQLFVETAKYMRLNPYLRDIYLVKYDNSKPAQSIVSRSAMMKIAEEHPAYDGLEDGIIVQNKNGEVVDRDGYIIYGNEMLLGGWAKVYRKDRSRPFVARLDIKEYSKQQSTWRSMEKTMVAKCACVAALRKAFPIQLSGMYTLEEMGQRDENVDIPVTPPIINQDIVYDLPIDNTNEINNDTEKPTVGNSCNVEEERVQDNEQAINTPKEEITPTPNAKSEDKVVDYDKIYYVKYQYYKDNIEKLEKVGEYDKSKDRLPVKAKKPDIQL